jgi:hypothetical protein
MTDNLTNPENVTTSAERSDAITATASPRPWRAMYTRILDARGKSVCVCEKDSMHGRADDETAKADAALIVEAVNEHHDLYAAWLESASGLVKTTSDLYGETKRRVAAEAERDRLRDLVRRLCDELESHYYEPQSMDDPSIVREARAAIGEDK